MLWECSLPRSLPALGEMFTFLAGPLAESSVDEATAYHVNLAAEEIFTNMVRHNRAEGDEISIGLEITDEQIRLELTDRGVEPFDPESLPEVDVTGSVEDREPGGLGIFLVKSLFDRLSYEFSEGDLKVTAVKMRQA